MVPAPPKSRAFAIISSSITLILNPESGNSVYYDGWTPKKTPTLNVCSGRKRKEKIQYARDKAESQWCEYAEGMTDKATCGIRCGT